MSTTSSTSARVARTISVPAEQDRWLTELLGKDGNLSAFVQTLIGCAQRGEIDPDTLVRGQRKDATQSRAYAYLRAKEAGMLFEEDVAALIKEALARKSNTHVVRGRIHNSGGSTYVADFSIECCGGKGTPQALACSVQCKSSPRASRLQMALAEAMIGHQKTNKPVITVVPYFTAESEPVLQQFKLLGYPICTLSGLAEEMQKCIDYVTHLSKELRRNST